MRRLAQKLRKRTRFASFSSSALKCNIKNTIKKNTVVSRDYHPYLICGASTLLVSSTCPSADVLVDELIMPGPDTGCWKCLPLRRLAAASPLETEPEETEWWRP